MKCALCSALGAELPEVPAVCTVRVLPAVNAVATCERHALLAMTSHRDSHQDSAIMETLVPASDVDAVRAWFKGMSELSVADVSASIVEECIRNLRGCLFSKQACLSGCEALATFAPKMYAFMAPFEWSDGHQLFVDMFRIYGPSATAEEIVTMMKGAVWCKLIPGVQGFSTELCYVLKRFGHHKEIAERALNLFFEFHDSSLSDTALIVETSCDMIGVHLLDAELVNGYLKLISKCFQYRCTYALVRHRSLDPRTARCFIFVVRRQPLFTQALATPLTPFAFWHMWRVILCTRESLSRTLHVC
jgi:hypothetical protein